MDVSVSIIVPMYNAEKTIERTLKSIQTQTHTNFTALLIDDGSTDRTRVECQSFIENDPRFHYYYKTNGGVSSARNFGLSLVETDCIGFLDSDDYYDPSFLETLCRALTADSHTDLVACSFERNNVIHFLEEKVVTYQYAIENLPDKTGIMGYMCNKLFKASIINQHRILFNESVHYGEDLLFIIRYLLKARQVRYISDVLFHYVYHENSKTANLKHGETLTHITALKMVIAGLEKNNLPKRIITKYQNVYYRIATGYLFKHNFSLSRETITKFETIIQTIDYSSIKNQFILTKVILAKIFLKFLKIRLILLQK